MSGVAAIAADGAGTGGGDQLIVRCCSCTHGFAVSAARRLAVCPACGQRMGTGPLRVVSDFSGGKLCTAGDVEIGPRAAVVAELVCASGSVDIAGAIEATVRCLGTVRVRSTGSVRGRVSARRLVIDPGARMDGALVEVLSPTVDLVDVLGRRAASGGGGL